MEILITFAILLVTGITIIYLFSDEHLDKVQKKMIDEYFEESKNFNKEEN